MAMLGLPFDNHLFFVYWAMTPPPVAA